MHSLRKLTEIDRMFEEVAGGGGLVSSAGGEASPWLFRGHWAPVCLCHRGKPSRGRGWAAKGEPGFRVTEPALHPPHPAPGVAPDQRPSFPRRHICVRTG